jgi:hypothetical protein
MASVLGESATVDSIVAPRMKIDVFCVPPET